MYYLLFLQIVGGAPLPKPMHLLYAVPCPWCSKTIWSTRLIWLIFWIHDSWESEWEKWLTPKIFVLQEYLEILWVCVGVLELALFHPFHPFFNGSFDDWIVNFCLRCFWGALSSSLLISRCSSTTPFYGSEQHQTCWKLSGNSSTLLNMYMWKWCSTKTNKSACSKSKATSRTHVAL